MSALVGSVDRVTTVIGERGMGKSTYLAHVDAPAFRRELGGFVIGHSPNGQIGSHPSIVFHDSIRRLGHGLRKAPHLTHVMTRGAPEDLLDYGQALALAVRKRAHERLREREFRGGTRFVPKFRSDRPAPPGLAAPPVLVQIDEGISMSRRPSSEELAELERLLTSARHSHLAITWSSQAPTARQWVLLEQSNRLRVFRYTHEYGANSLRAAGIHKDVIPTLRDLPRWSYYSFDKQDPHRAAFHLLPKP